MSTKIYVVKYIKDPRRWEPINVGIIATSEAAAASKFLGEQPDGRVFKTAVRHKVNDTDIYVDWVQYFKRTLTPGEDGIQSILRDTDSNFWVAEAGEVWQGPADPDLIVAQYYPKLIQAEDTESVAASVSKVERLFHEAGIADSPYLKREFEVPSTITRKDGSRVRHKHDYYWQNGHEIVGDVLTVNHAGWTRNTLFKLEHLEESVTKVGFVASPVTQPDLEAEIEGITNEAIYVDDNSALERIVSIFNE